MSIIYIQSTNGLKRFLTEDYKPSRSEVVNALGYVPVDLTRVSAHEKNAEAHITAEEREKLNNLTGADKVSLGLDKVDNTSDADKPVSTAQQAALDALQETLEGQVEELETTVDTHRDNKDIHVTAADKARWDDKNSANNETVSQHIDNNDIHVTAAEKSTWQQHLENYGQEVATAISVHASQDSHLTTGQKEDIAKIDGLTGDVEGLKTAVQEAKEAAEGAASQAATGASHSILKNNPHGVTKDQVGLDKVDNTSDADKPVSTAQQAALDALKQSLSEQVVGPDGNIIVTYDEQGVHTTEVWVPGGKVSELINNVDEKVDAHTSRKDNPHGVTKKQLGLDKVDNTPDISKPISTAQQAALDAIVNVINFNNEQAMTKINAANERINSVSSWTSDAQDTADEALNNAAYAVQLADAAQTTADTANTIANDAHQRAYDAQTTADDALPKSGGTVTGDVTVEGNFTVEKDVFAEYVTGSYGLRAGDPDSASTIYGELSIVRASTDGNTSNQKVFTLPNKTCTLGAQIYQHVVRVKSNEGASAYCVTPPIYTSSPTQFTAATFVTWLKDNGYSSQYAMMPVSKPSDSVVCGVCVYQNNLALMTMKIDGSGSNKLDSFVSDTVKEL